MLAFAVHSTFIDRRPTDVTGPADHQLTRSRWNECYDCCARTWTSVFVQRTYSK